uniref:Calmodulin-binding domain-containing protein n=1 Tax=Leersia perrieri TaxID=77586 RepID=A0A0D9W367_9ORYZ
MEATFPLFLLLQSPRIWPRSNRPAGALVPSSPLPDRPTASPPAPLSALIQPGGGGGRSATTMATSRKDPPSRDRPARMSPNLRPSSSESSAGYGTRRARSVPSSPDRKFGSSAAAPTAASGSPDRPPLSLAGRSISSRSMSSSSSSAHGSRTQPFPKPTLARVKSEKASTAASPRPPALAVPASNSFKDMTRTASASKVPSTLQKSKMSPRPSPDKAAASPKPSTLRSPASVTARGGRTPVLSSTRASGSVAAKKRAEGANGCSVAAASSKARSGAPQRAMGASATSKEEKEDEPSMQFDESESISTPSIEDHLHEQLPDPIDLKPMDMTASHSALSDQQAPFSDILEQQVKSEEEVMENISEDKEVAGDSELQNGGQCANEIAKDVPGIVKVDDESQQAEKEEAKAKADKIWRKDEPKSNDVIEETKSKLLEERKSRVKALVGAFETVMSFKE